MIEVKFKKLDSSAVPFSYTREGDACMDMYALNDDIIYPHSTGIIPTGIAVEIPEGYEGIVRGRSGLNSRGMKVAIGTIDETYRGDVGIIITNHTDAQFIVEKGMRLAQFTVKPVHRVQLVELTELTNTERGVNGYGSSGL